MIDRKSVKALVTGVLNGDDAEVNRIVEACVESVFNAKVETATKAVLESIGTKKKPVIG
jgi:hypothetical protein